MSLACIKIKLSFNLENPKSKDGFKIQIGKNIYKGITVIINIAEYPYLNRLT